MKKQQISRKVVLALMLAVFTLMVCACSVSVAPVERQREITFGKTDKQIVDDVLMNNDLASYSGYREEDLVWVAVTIDGKSLVDAYLDSTAASTGEFLLTAEGTNMLDAIKAQQNAVIADIAQSGINITVKHSYTAVTNGFAAQVRYGDLQRLRSVDGVKQVVLSQQYTLASSGSGNYAFNSLGINTFDGNGMLVNDTEYQGQGMVLAVIDSGIDWQHEVFATDPERPAINAEFVASVMGALYAESTFKIGDAAEFYKTAKVPFGFDYANGDTDPIPDIFTYFRGFGLEHGTHVAGIATGNNDVIRSAAPEAQLLAMKVGNDDDGSILMTDIIAAVNDAIILGADAINLSLGSACGPVEEIGDYDFMDDVYTLCDKVGIAVCVASGNDTSAATAANKNYTSNPDSGVVGSPASYKGSLSVGSIDALAQAFVSYEGIKIAIHNSIDMYGVNYNFNDILGDKQSAEIEFVVIPGNGEPADYEGLDVKGKIAVVKRGVISFTEKQQNAADEGAIGCLVYNNEESNIRAQLEDPAIPTAVISMADGEMLAKAGSGKLYLDKTYFYIPVSEFSSMGALDNLDIGVDVVAPGGNIYSSVPFYYSMIEGLEVDYDYMSGTSMATPNLMAAAGVIRQYIAENYPYLTRSQAQNMLYQIMMSTADIAVDDMGNPASPRKQGAGVVNIEKAVTADTYLTVTGSDRVKLNLGSDYNRDGVYTLKFNVVNMGNEARSFNVDAFVMTESAVDGFVIEKAYMLDGADIRVSSSNALVDGNILTVEAGQTAKVKIVITLTEENKAYMDETFENGIYVEGFATLESLDDGVDLSIPYISFYGDWDRLPMFEPTIIEEMNGDELSQLYYTMLGLRFEHPDNEGLYVTVPMGIYNGLYALPAGYEMPRGSFDNIALGKLGELSTLQLSLLRNAVKTDFNFVDEYGKAYYVDDTLYRLSKAYSYNGFMIQVVQISFTGVDTNNFTWANNQIVNFEIKAYWDIEKDIYETLTFPIFIDYEAPTMVGADVVEKEGRKILSLDVFDNHVLMNMALYTDNGEGLVKLIPEAIPAYNFNQNMTNRIEYDITDIYDNIVDGKLTVLLRDYAMNEIKYEINLDGETGGNIEEVNTYPDAEYSNSEYLMTADGRRYLSSVQNVISYNGSKTVVNDEEGETFVIDANGVLTAYNGPGGKVIVPDGVKQIGQKVFEQRYDITEVVLPEGLTAIGTSAFELCSYMEKINLPSTLQYIDWYAFAACRRLATVDFTPCVDTLKSIGRNAFLGCGFKELTVPDFKNENVIEADSMFGFLEIETLIIYEDVDILGNFRIMPKLTKLEIYGDVYNSDYSAGLSATFAGFDSLEVVNFHGDITNLGYHETIDYYIECSYIMSALPKLREVNFFGDVGKIDGYALASCPELEKVVFHGDLGYIGARPFANCPKLTEFTVAEGNDKLIYDEATGVVYSKDKSRMFIPAGWWFDGIFEVPETVKELAKGQFGTTDYIPEPLDGIWEVSDTSYTFFVGTGVRDYDGKTKLGGVKLHSGITAIPEQCFYGCERMATPDYNGAVIESIGDQAFSYSGITEFIMPETLKSMAGSAFAYAQKLEVFEFNSSIGAIEWLTFDMCSSLKKIVLPEYITSMYSRMFYECSSLERVEFKCKDITYIEAYAFYGTKSLKEVIGLDKVRGISSGAFGESGITSYKAPESLLSISGGAFMASALETVELNEGLQSVGTQAFAMCENLKVINIPSTLTNVLLNDMLYGCATLDNVNVSEAHPVFASHEGVVYNKAYTEMMMYPLGKLDEEYTTPDTLKQIGANILEGVMYLKVINMPEVEVIGDLAFYMSSVERVVAPNLRVVSDGAFAMCENLYDINILNVDYIGAQAFYGTAITEVTLENMSYVGMEAFAFCENLTEVTLGKNIAEFDFSVTFYKAGIEKVNVSEDCESFIYENDTLYSKGKTIMYRYFGKAEVLEIAEGVQKIAHEAVMGNEYVKEVVFASTVTAIGDKAFYGCENLEKLVFRSEKAPRLQGFYVEGARYLYNNFGTNKLVVECNGHESFRTVIWMLFTKA